MSAVRLWVTERGLRQLHQMITPNARPNCKIRRTTSWFGHSQNYYVLVKENGTPIRNKPEPKADYPTYDN